MNLAAWTWAAPDDEVTMTKKSAVPLTDASFAQVNCAKLLQVSAMLFDSFGGIGVATNQSRQPAFSFKRRAKPDIDIA